MHSASRNHQRLCPLNGKLYRAVGSKTLRHQLRTPWRHDLDNVRYYYCTDAKCPIIYFRDDDMVVKWSEVRGGESSNAESLKNLACHCFGISKQDAELDDSLRDYVVTQTKSGNCACEVKSPSGKCCLAVFPKSAA
jgi:hypothetical protein